MQIAGTRFQLEPPQVSSVQHNHRVWFMFCSAIDSDYRFDSITESPSLLYFSRHLFPNKIPSIHFKIQNACVEIEICFPKRNCKVRYWYVVSAIAISHPVYNNCLKLSGIKTFYLTV